MILRAKASGLVKSHSTGGRLSPALVSVDFDWTGGRLIVLTGANGAGKTTLLRILAGLDQADAGSVEIYRGSDAFSGPAQLRGLGAWLSDRPAFSAHLSARAVMEESLILDGVVTANRSKRLAEAALRFPVADLWNRPGVLASRGQQALLSLARLSMLSRSCWWLDEPFAALDKDSIAQVCAWIDELLTRGDLVVLCTHQADGGPALNCIWPAGIDHHHLSAGRLARVPS